MANTCKQRCTAVRELPDRAGASWSVKPGVGYLPSLKKAVSFFVEQSCARGHYLPSRSVYGNF